MSLLDRLFRRRIPAADIERRSRQIPVAATAPEEERLRCLCESDQPQAACDWMDWSCWQDKQTGQVWVHCSGGVADVDQWYGPGDCSLAAQLGTV